MHKYFAKTLFLGKKVEFLPECHSTNDELNKRIKKNDITEGFVMQADHQVAGRGQRGNAWLSEAGKNLLFSIYIQPKYLLGRQAYLLNIACGLAIIGLLKKYLNSSDLSLKWPNDAYVMDRKIAGILIETSIGQAMISDATVGIGLNVNQDFFHLSVATSLKMETGHQYDRDELLEEFLVFLEHYLLKLKKGPEGILNEYYQYMRWRGEIHSFRSAGTSFEGEIIGVNESGKLLINSNNTVESFDVKEIEFLH